MAGVSIIVPVLNEAAGIATMLGALQRDREAGCEIIVVDGGSVDDTGSLAAALCDQVVTAPRGRASQMNAGAARARGDILLFLHADTRLPARAIERIEAAMRDRRATWGRFDVEIDGRAPILKIVARMMNLRSRLTGIATGDQAIFVRADDFRAVGGFPDQPLMEDIAFSTLMRKRARPVCLQDKVVTSGRRWEKTGVLRTIALMWRLRLAYFLGADPEKLAVRYGYAPRPK